MNANAATKVTTGLILLAALVGCSSDGVGDTTDAGGDTATPVDTAMPPMDGMGTDTKSSGDAAPTDTKGAADTTPPVDPGPMSADCKTYCDCFETNCASIQKIPGGVSCGAFCAGFTKDQWSCRNNHCQLVVPEKNPGHCMHAVGIDQCM